MLSDAAQQSLPQDAQVALQQVDNCESCPPAAASSFPPHSSSALTRPMRVVNTSKGQLLIEWAVKYFLISAPVDWTPDQYIRRFLLPTGEYVSCVLW